MTPERWRQIEELYHAAQGRAPQERAALLAGCDPGVRAKVEALLAQDSGEKILDYAAADLLEALTETIVTVGSQYGPYQIEAVIGVGGMGQVYRALDTRLGRKVALKISAERFSSRFGREARAIAAFNHPHICTLYDIGPNYLVMELVDGETLSNRLKKGKLSINDTILYGAQIADTLSEAHAKGIVHRDLKPANIMLTRSGVKLLDFGIALSAQDPSLTSSGAMIGTPSYMAPEQLAGAKADARSDIYALGLVLVEMATGQRVTQGQPLPVEALPKELADIIVRCLEPDPFSRWPAARDVEQALRSVAQTATRTPEMAPKRVSRRTLVWASGAMAVTAGGLWLGRSLWRKPRPAAVHVAIPVIEGAASADPGRQLGPLAMAPDGSAVVVSLKDTAGEYLFIRRMDSDRLTRMEGTQGARYPFWSPDSRHVAFFAEAKLKRMPAVGGSPVVICEAPETRGGSWGSRGIIIFAINLRSIFQVAASGGAATPVTLLDKATAENSHRYPVFLPDGNRFLYFARTDNLDQRGIYMESLDRRQPRRRVLVADGQFAIGPDPESGEYYLLTQQSGKIIAQNLDITRGVPSGEPQILLDRAGQVSISGTGLLVLRTEQQDLSRLVWRDRTGREVGSLGTPTDYWTIALSADDRFAATVKHDYLTGLFTVWMGPLPQGPLEPFSDSHHASTIAWSHDSSALYYCDYRQRKLLRRKVNPRGVEEVEREIGAGTFIVDISTDQRRAVAELTKDTDHAEVVWMDFGEGRWRSVGAEGKQGLLPTFSPDGKWLAFGSNQTGSPEIYCIDFPGASLRKRISTAGGSQARWRNDGKELFYLASDGTLMAVEISMSTDLRAAAPKPLFHVNWRRGSPGSVYGVSGDGQRFLVIEGVDQSLGSDIEMILNWPSLLRR